MIEPVGARPVADLHEIYQWYTNNNPGPAPASAADQARFEAAMEVSQAQIAPPVEMARPITEATSTDSNLWVLPPTGPEANQVPPPTLGDTILDGMTNLRDGWSEMRESLNTIEANPKLEPTEMVKVLYDVQQTTILFSLVTNEVSQASRKVDGLLKAG